MQSQEKPQSTVNVNVTLTIVPFGSMRIQESWALPGKELERPMEQETPPDEFFFPEGTSVSEVIPSPLPTLVMVY